MIKWILLELKSYSSFVSYFLCSISQILFNELLLLSEKISYIQQNIIAATDEKNNSQCLSILSVLETN